MNKQSNQGLNLSDSPVIEQIREIYKKLGIPLNGMSKELEEILDLCKAYSEKMEEKNPYKTLMEMQQKAKEQLSTDIDDYEDISQKRLAIDKWYYDELKKLHQNKAGLFSSELNQAKLSLDDLYDKRILQAS